MKLYDCKLRLAGNVNHEVMKSGVSAAEIEVLRALHGSDAVVDIKPGTPGENTRNSAQERAYLNRTYASEESLSSQSLGKRKALLRDLFGHDRLPLPDEPLDAVAADEGDEEIEAAPVPVVRTRVARKPAEAAALE